MEKIFKAAIEAAEKNNISTIVVASTTGKTAAKLLELVKTEKLKVIVVTHDEGRPPQERRFDKPARIRLLANNITVCTHNLRTTLLHKIIERIF